MARHGAQPYDVIVLDMMLPGMNGYESVPSSATAG